MEQLVWDNIEIDDVAADDMMGDDVGYWEGMVVGMLGM